MNVRLMRLMAVATSGAAAVLTVSVGLAHAECSPDSVSLRGDWGKARFCVEVADSSASRAKGLMNRESLAESAGMLFVYETPRAASFWMKNTLIPLDMIFADGSGLVTRIHENAVPLDTTPIDGGENVVVVLEINGGLAGKLGITEGSEISHPSIDQSIARWPCGS